MILTSLVVWDTNVPTCENEVPSKKWIASPALGAVPNWPLLDAPALVLNTTSTLEIVVDVAIPVPVIVAPSTTDEGLSTTTWFCPLAAIETTLLELTVSPTVKIGSLTLLNYQLTILSLQLVIL